MAEINLRGRRIPLLYTVYEMKLIQEQIVPLGEIYYKLFGRSREDENDTSQYCGPEHLQTLAGVIRILGNAGLEENGETADLTDKWILRALRPLEINQAIRACLDAMNEGMESEIPSEEENGQPVDATLEEIERKKKRES